MTCNCAPRTHSLNTPQQLNARTMLNSATHLSAAGRRLHALLMHSRCIKCFCEGAKTLLFKGKRVGNAPTATFQRDAASAASPPARSKAHSARPTRCGFSREPTRYNHRTRSTPPRTAHLQSCCPSAEHARDPRKRAMPETCNPAPKTKSFQQNSRPARINSIKSRPAACTSGGINNFPLKRKGRP